MVADVERSGEAFFLFLEAAGSGLEVFAFGALGPKAERHGSFVF